MRPISFLLLVLMVVACGPAVQHIKDGTGGGTSAGGGSATGGSTGGGTGSATGGGLGTNSFGTQCSGAPTTLTGTVLAPNGLDPVPSAEVAVWFAAPASLARGVVCENCAVSADVPLASTITGLDGSFVLNLDAVTKSTSLVVTVRKARFRTVNAAIAITACGATSLAGTKVTLPGSSAAGDLPRIAVSSGNRDHLENVLRAMGITEYDCVKGLAASSTAETCTRPTTLGQLLADPTQLATYGMLFIACAPSDTFEPGSAAAAANLRTWVNAGGKLIVTDDSYDFVEQAFPDAVDFMAPAAAAGVAQAPNTAEVGVAVTSLTGTVTDSNLQGWLSHFPATIAGNAVQLTGFLSKWAVMRGVGLQTSVLVHGPASWTGGTGDVPLTASFEVNHCGRVIFSSYHTDSGSTSLKPQERILEYLMLQVGQCTEIN